MKPRRIRQIQVFTWNQMLRSRAGRALARTIEVVDEAWYLLQFADTARDLCERARRFRKKNASLVIATQQVDDFLANPYAATILGLASTHLLFGQKPTAVGRLAELFQLTAGEAGQLTRLDPGQYFLKTSKLRMFLYKPAPPDRHRLYTTKPSELLAMAEGA
jgi:type IV secretory pathway VirB4 component